MVKTKEIAYRIYSRYTGEHFCNVLLKFRCAHIDNHNACHMGRVSLIYFYKPTNKSEIHSGNLKVDSFYKDEWIKSSVGEYYDFPVNNFIPPTCLRGQGINTFIWSQFYRGLPAEIQGKVILRGKLSSSDANIPLLDKHRRVVHMWEKNSLKTMMINNIEKRNKFWSKCLKENDHFDLTYDKNTGEGAFRGIFTDPYPYENDDYTRLKKILITKIDTQQVTEQPITDKVALEKTCITL